MPCLPDWITSQAQHIAVPCSAMRAVWRHGPCTALCAVDMVLSKQMNISQRITLPAALELLMKDTVPRLSCRNGLPGGSLETQRLRLTYWPNFQCDRDCLQQISGLRFCNDVSSHQKPESCSNRCHEYNRNLLELCCPSLVTPVPPSFKNRC
jgi:hypothetical protein